MNILEVYPRFIAASDDNHATKHHAEVDCSPSPQSEYSSLILMFDITIEMVK